MLISVLVAAMTLVVPPGCRTPWSAMGIAHNLESQRVGHGWKHTEDKERLADGAISKPDKIILLTFGCVGDYQEELAQEEHDLAGVHWVRFTNDQQLVIVVFLRAPTPREATVVRLTLAALDSD